MKINTNVRYGLRALIEIGLNSGAVLQKKIAEQQEIPLNYLDSIISGLKNAGLIINHGGKGSGYLLARKPDDITIYQIYRAFSPDLQLVNCCCETNECKRSAICPAKDFWFELNSQIKDIMEHRTLKELIE
ncbi:MAG: Rrf2 family transcriptional regulator [Bacteroidales bacterium]|jgi:Rrf2 family protein